MSGQCTKVGQPERPTSASTRVGARVACQFAPCNRVHWVVVSRVCNAVHHLPRQDFCPIRWGQLYPQLGYVRYWMLTNCRVVGSIDLHPDTFQPRNGTQTSLLILQRKIGEEIRREALQGRLDDYPIFMAQVRAIGHDKRGNTVYVRNEDGEEILFPPDDEEAAVLVLKDNGAERRTVPPAKRVDDDTPKVADAFLEWKARAVLGW